MRFLFCGRECDVRLVFGGLTRQTINDITSKKCRCISPFFSLYLHHYKENSTPLMLLPILLMSVLDTITESTSAFFCNLLFPPVHRGCRVAVSLMSVCHRWWCRCVAMNLSYMHRGWRYCCVAVALVCVCRSLVGNWHATTIHITSKTIQMFLTELQS